MSTDALHPAVEDYPLICIRIPALIILVYASFLRRSHFLTGDFLLRRMSRTFGAPSCLWRRC